MTNAVEVRGLAKRYRDGTEAVRGISFSVAAGEIVGVVGPNGAGKSTMLNMLATLVMPTDGEAFILGRSVRDRAAVRPLVGVALQVTGLDPLMSAADHFLVHAALYGIADQPARRRTDALLRKFSLDAVRDRRAGALSIGTQRRLSLALALLHDPKVIIFDEPTVGLDPTLRRSVWALLAELREQGLAVLFSTHYLEEAEQLCDRIVLMSQGAVVAIGTPDQLKANAAAGILRIRVRAEPERVAPALAAARERGILHCPHELGDGGALIELHADLGGVSIDAMTSLLAEFGIEILDMRWNRGSLDEAFARLSDAAGDESGLQPVTMEHRALARRGRRA